jgi:hypothetical protein
MGAARLGRQFVAFGTAQSTPAILVEIARGSTSARNVIEAKKKIAKSDLNARNSMLD